LEKDHFNKFTIWATARQGLTPSPEERIENDLSGRVNPLRLGSLLF
jgi:hypothetical protein